jgi:hypothetical protein
MLGPMLNGPAPMIGSLTDARCLPVYVRLDRNQGMWTLLWRSLRPVVRIPGLARVPVLWVPTSELDYTHIGGTK